MKIEFQANKKLVAGSLALIVPLLTAAVVGVVNLGIRTQQMVSNHEERLQTVEELVAELVPRSELEAYQTLLLGRLDRIEDKLDRWVERH